MLPAHFRVGTGTRFPLNDFEVCYGGWTTLYSWDKANWPAGKIPDWAAKGLCRVAVREGKFHVVFPAPQAGRP